MIISDPAKAESYLSRISYFRLSAYWYRFRMKTGTTVDDGFKPDTTFKSVIELYVLSFLWNPGGFACEALDSKPPKPVGE